MSVVISMVLGIIKAIPIVDGWFQELMVAYFDVSVGFMKKENRDAVQKSIVDHDQRPLETVIGSQTAGKPSGDAGTVIVDGPPPNVGLPKS